MSTVRCETCGRLDEVGTGDIVIFVECQFCSRIRRLLDENKKLKEKAKALLDYLYIFGGGNPRELEALADHCNALDCLMKGGVKCSRRASQSESDV